MITKETCVKIFNCHNEIEKCEKLMVDMAKRLKEDIEKNSPTLSNAFGEKRGLQLGIPCGDNAHQLFNVNIDLGVKIIEQHILDNKRKLTELRAIALIELKGGE